MINFTCPSVSLSLSGLNAPSQPSFSGADFGQEADVRSQGIYTQQLMKNMQKHTFKKYLKKIVFSFQRKRTAHERAKELYASGEFSSGRRWADDAPKEKVDTTGVNLIDSGACGAFVHGLEDEMYGMYFKTQPLSLRTFLAICTCCSACLFIWYRLSQRCVSLR